MSHPAYPSYRDAQIDWLPRIPSHWTTEPLKRLVHLRSGDAITADRIDEDGDFPVYGGNGRRGFTSSWTHDGNHVLIGRQGALCGNVNYATGRFWASEHAVVATPRRPLETRWLGETLRAMNLNQYSLSAAQPGLSVEQLGRLRVPLPPIGEQSAIAAFLDRETAKIDTLVAEQERLIELLKEKRQAVISHAVTKGLNPDAPMKPSGVEWIGAVPEHWAVGAFRYYGRFRTGGTPDRGVPSYWGGGIPWVKTGEINYSPITSTEETLSVEGLAASSAIVLQPGAVLMALYGQGATRGRVALLRIPAACNQACAAIEPDSRVSSSFLFAFLEFAYPFIREAGNETTQMNLSLDYVRGLRIVVPPFDEQLLISMALDARLLQLDSLVEEARRAMKLLNERRSALISAAVTGQIDVRGLVNPEAA